MVEDICSSSAGGAVMHDLWHPWHGCVRISEGCASRLICNGCRPCGICEKTTEEG